MTTFSPEPIFQIRCPELSSLTALCFHENERLLAGTFDGLISLWEMGTCRRLDIFQATNEPITFVHHIDDMLFLQGNSGNIRSMILNSTGYRLRRNYEILQYTYCRAEYIKNKKLLAFPKQHNIISFIDITNETYALTDLQPPSDKEFGNITLIKNINKNGQDYVVAGYEYGDMLTWDLRSKKIITYSKTDMYPMDLDFNLNMDRCILGSINNNIRILSFQPQQSNNLELIGNISLPHPGVSCLKIRNDLIISGGMDGNIQFFSLENLRPLALFRQHRNYVSDITFSTDIVPMWNCNLMGVASGDEKITVWGVYD